MLHGKPVDQQTDAFVSVTIEISKVVKGQRLRVGISMVLQGQFGISILYLHPYMFINILSASLRVRKICLSL